MITIKKSATADTRTCDFSQVTKEQLYASSKQHIGEVTLGIEFFKCLLDEAKFYHDFDKLTGIDSFHEDFLTGFERRKWRDNHLKISRHHLGQDDGVPSNVNLIDVLEMIVDCVMAGMGRRGSLYPFNLNPNILTRAFDNTVDLLKSQIIVEKDCSERRVV